MSDLPNPPHADSAFDEHVLLEQGAWVRRLARGLVSDDAAAEDLSQDVMMAALSSGPALSGAQLRGWLATVARRLAGRKYERESARRHTERSVARHEAEDRGVTKRLELHRQLTSAVERLDEPYRTALVLRYFEGLAPREIAERTGISSTAARKRVSRGLASLREDLDGEFGDRKAWLTALAPLAFPFKKVAPIAGDTSLLALAKTKLALVAGVACFAGLVYLYTPFFESSPPVDGLEGRGGVPVSLLAVGDSPTAPDPGTPTFRAPLVDSNRTPVTDTPGSGPRVRVVDADGAFPSGAHAAWMDPFSQVHPIELDAEGTAPRPTNSVGARFFAFDLNTGSAVVTGGPDGDDALLVLAPGQALVGRVLVDGAPPARPLLIQANPLAKAFGLHAEEKSQCCFLEEMSAIRGPAKAWTTDDGSFMIPGFPPGSEGVLTLPSSLALLPGQVLASKESIAYTLDDRELLVLTTLRPFIHGRFIWADTGLPVASGLGEPGIVWSRLQGRRGPDSPLDHSWIDRDGRFEIGVESTTEFTAVVFGLTSSTAGPGRDSEALFSERVEFAGRDFPIDLGTLVVERPWTTTFRVVDPDGFPIGGATLASSLGSTKADADGFANLPCEPGETVFALARGTSVSKVQLGVALPAPDEVQTLVLEPGVDFSIDLGPTPNALLTLELAWDVTPFQGTAIDGPGPFEPFPAKLLFALHGAPAPGGHWRRTIPGAPGAIRMFLPSSGRIDFPGMRPGARFEARLLDSLGAPLVRQEIRLPEVGESLDIELLPTGGASLEVRLFDTNGHLIPGSRVAVRAVNGNRKDTRFDCVDGHYTLAPLAQGELSILAMSLDGLEARAPSYVVNTPHQVLELVLEPH
jgi:RNA polymerase sigma-70 factor (ECF subfamily)